MAAFEPSSSISRFSADCRATSRPTADEPVKDTSATRGSSVRSRATSAGPGSTLRAPAGQPAASASSARARIASGVWSGGLITTGQPAPIAGPSLWAAIRSGKLKAGMPATTPTGSATVMPIRPSAPGIASSGSTSPTVRVAASAQNRRVPTARCTSSRVSRTVLPVSDSSRPASSGPRASTRAASSARIAARRDRGSAEVSGSAAEAAASAASTSAGPACATIAAVLPSHGNRTGAAEVPGAGDPATSSRTGAATAAVEMVLSDIAANLRA